jgi:hypothetical protein
MNLSLSLPEVGRNYVRIGSLSYPPGAVEKLLHRYAKALVCINAHDDHQYTLRGSMTTLKLNERYFALLCRHQINGYDPSNIILFPSSEGGATYIGGGIFNYIEGDARSRDE